MMHNEIWRNFINWMSDHGILISAIVSVISTMLNAIFNLNSKYYRYFVFATLALTLIFCAEFYLIQFAYFPFTIIIPIEVLATFILLGFKNIYLKKKYALWLFGFNSLLLLLAFDLAKASMNTWGSGTIFSGVFMIVHLLPLYQLLQFIPDLDRPYGKIKIGTGALSIFIIAFLEFSNSDYNSETVELVRASLLLLAFTIVLEGFILVLKRK